MFDVLKRFRKLYDPWVTAAPSRSRPRRTVHLRGPEILEARDAPAVDMWQPGHVNLLASNAANWSNGLPNGQDVVFDGSKSNQQIVWDQSYTPSSITLQNKYTSKMVLNPGVVLAVAGSINGQATSTLNVNFMAPSCTLAIQGGTSTLTNFNLTDQNGLFALEGGTLNAAGSTNQSSATIQVFNGTTLNMTAGAGLRLTDGAQLKVYQGGTLGLDGSGNGLTIQTDGTAGSILNNAGTINFTGTAGGLGSNLNLPILRGRSRISSNSTTVHCAA